MTSFSGIQSLEPFSTSHRAGGGGEIVNEATVTVADHNFHVRLEDVSLVCLEMDTFLDVQMLGSKPKTLLLERT